ncbi:YceD family protein [Ideonella oryzae]|uniref:Large ribosomal RNA subunit accumulation protein YceD n=1 Tax=Ideonella oryzae TaxID=2937441 RepID=A0ABT1BHV3_9BURK|nr:YceD family protein [Ideonella oryzae]MCO5975800.1 YceD family protein [Ideonella oryzae]
MTTAADPRKLDIARSARDADHLQGEWPLTDLPRLAEAQVSEEPAPPVQWSAQAELRPVLGGEGQTWLHLQAHAEVAMACQRCLAPVRLPVAVDRWIRFVTGEEQAEALDADSEDDVLALPRWLDLAELIEDELLLALPIVPRHEVCPAPLPIPAQPAEEESAEARPNPFAVLAQLKSRS